MNESYSRKPLLLHPSPSIPPKYDLRAPAPPRHLRLLIGEALFHEQDAPLV